MTEVWKEIEGYEGYYEVSSFGRVRSIDRYVKGRWDAQIFCASRFMKCKRVKNGYLHVKLTKDGERKEPLVHRLVASAFIPNPEGLEQVNHIDGDKTNNNVDNLEWCSASQNQLHSRRVLKRICGHPRKPVICLENRKVYESAHHAARDLGLNPAGIYYTCEGRNKQTGNMHFEYV